MRPSDLLMEFGRPVAYYSGLSKHLGGVKATVLFCQLFYWQGKEVSDFGVYKSAEDIEEETGLNYREQQKAREALRKIGVLIETHKRLEHRIYYKIDIQVLNDLLIDRCISRNDKSVVRETTKAQFDETTKAQFVIHRIPESTSENTTERNPRSQMLADFSKLWDTWPKDHGEKGSRKKAEDAYLKLKPNDSLLRLMISARDKQASHKSMMISNGLFASPFQHVERWIKNRRWEDEISEDSSSKSDFPTDFYI